METRECIGFALGRMPRSLFVFRMVGALRFELRPRCSQSRCATRAFRDFVAAFNTHFDVLITEVEEDPGFDQNLLNTAADLDGMRQLRQTIIDAARGKPLLTFTCNYTTPANKPAEHTATAVIGWQGFEVGIPV